MIDKARLTERTGRNCRVGQNQKIKKERLP
ncbi:hypothetical protein CLS_20410 [[Clostridium] cf. saccharolyticum K10]|nr:hypothetical protein CLS_20410 [[Clostridium] cf. saccharolyticum K10]